MIKLMGAVLILSAGVMLGSLPLVSMKERTRLLNGYVDALKAMKAELSAQGLSIPKLMDVLSEGNSSHHIFAYLSSYIAEHGVMEFSVGWRSYIMSESSIIEEDELRSLMSVGDMLGKYTLEDQISEIEHCIEILERGIENTRQKQKEITKLYLGTSLSLSLMLIIALL